MSQSESRRADTVPGAGQDSADARMADLLQGRHGSRAFVREGLRHESSREAEEVLQRLNALEFVDGVVGDAHDLPDRLGDYRITGLLGRGGMGTVYEAFQETLEREVALKVLAPSLSADPTMRQRFRTEARATASLHHEHIVPIYDFGEAGGVLYFAMEKVAGVSLDKHIAAARRQGRPSMEPREAAARFAGVAEALFHAHRRGILHRDVKPGNLLVAPDGTLALADFGLSKIAGEASMSLTAGGAFLGTLSYAAPEQAKGQELSPASDLYSLGVTVFEAVTGGLPLLGKTPEAMLDAVLHGTPKRLRAVLPRAPKDLDAVLDKLLAKEPGDRYADGEELARDLRRVAEGEPVKIRRQALWLRAWRKVRKNKGLSATIALSVVLALMSVALAALNRRERRSSAEARHENFLQQAMGEASRETGPAAGPAGLLLALTGVDVAPSAAEESTVLAELSRARRLQPGDPVAETLTRAYADDPLPEATALLRQGYGYRAEQLLDAAIDAAKDGFEARDNATWLRLYRLYLARGTARLCASVGQPERAKLDLFAASFIRSGAFFPKLLLELVDWSQGRAAPETLTRVQDLVADGPKGSERVAALLLQAFAGLRRADACHLLRVDRPWSERKQLDEESARLLGEPPSSLVRTLGAWTGMEKAFAEIGGAALRVLGNRVALEPSIQRGLDLLQAEVGEASPLRSWELIFQLLRDPSGLARDLARPTPQQIAGWIDLLQLEPPTGFVQGQRPRVEELLTRSGGVPAAAQLRTLLARRVGSARELLDAAGQWLVLEPENPWPLLCRFQALVMDGQVVAASFCGAELLQKVSERAPFLREMLGVLRAAEAKGGADAARWKEVRAQFERLAG